MSGLYIHIPFCHSKCYYCDFYSLPHNDDRHGEYIEALKREYYHRQNEIYPINPSTIYIGGGTPSILPIRLLDDLLSAMPIADAEEITIEVNPEDVTESFADFLRHSPINRVSMGVQSLDADVLRNIGRRHSPEDAIRAISMLRESGIDNLSLDLIFGLPGQTLQSWQHSLEQILSFKPEHLSAYSLMLEPGTRLYAMARSGRFKESDQELSEQMYRVLCSSARESGMEHYEISNFALPGYRSRHNSAYWDLTPYLGLGPGAHSFDGQTRRYNPSDLKLYLQSGTSLTETETISPAQMINEYLLLRLRTLEGLSLNDFHLRFGEEEKDRLIRRADPYIRNGNLTLTPSALSIDERHWLVSDSILVDLFC